MALKGPKRHVVFCVPTSFLDTSTNIRHQNLYALNYALEVQRPLKCSPRTFQKCMELFIHPKLGNILWVFDFQGCSFQFRYSLLLPMNEPVCANRKQPNGDNGSSHWHSSRLGIRPWKTFAPPSWKTIFIRKIWKTKTPTLQWLATNELAFVFPSLLQASWRLHPW